VAKSATGRWVSRVGASGGGKAYKKTRPGNFYGALVVIVVLAWSPPSSHAMSTSTRPRPRGRRAQDRHHLVRRPLDSGLRQELAVPVDRYHAEGSGHVRADGRRAQDQSGLRGRLGNNATLAQFGNEYPGLLISSTQMNIPKNQLGASNPRRPTPTDRPARPARARSIRARPVRSATPTGRRSARRSRPSRPIPRPSSSRPNSNHDGL